MVVKIGFRSTVTCILASGVPEGTVPCNDEMICQMLSNFTLLRVMAPTGGALGGK